MSDPGDERRRWWNEAYDSEDVPWDVGRPQAEIVAVERAGGIEGRTLDVGCGTGAEARYLGGAGHDVTGIDFSGSAIDTARDRTDCRAVSFLTGDAFALSDRDLGTFDTVVDCGMLHTLEEGDRTTYAAELSSVLDGGGRVVCLEFGVDAPDDWGPTPLSATDVRRTFGDGWTVDVVEPVPFETRQRPVPGVLGIAERTARH